MPYIVTTKRPDLVSAQVRNMRGGLVVSRVVVATLEKARIAAVEALADHYEHVSKPGVTGLIAAAFKTPESGGTITLPDGTIIEVERT